MRNLAKIWINTMQFGKYRKGDAYAASTLSTHGADADVVTVTRNGFGEFGGSK